MIDEIGPDVRALLAAGREQLGPDAATIARLRSRIDSAVAVTPAGAATTFAVKLTFVAVAATVGAAGIYRVRDSVPPITPSLEIAGSETPELEMRVALGTSEAAPPAAEAEPAPRTRQREVTMPAAEAPHTGISLAREIELVDHATLVLRRGELSAALVVLAGYERESAGAGQLAHEASAIKIEALCRAQSPDARSELARFGERWPRSPQHPHLISICAKEDQP